MEESNIVKIAEKKLYESKNISKDFKLGVRFFALYLQENYQLLDKVKIKFKKGWLAYEES